MKRGGVLALLVGLFLCATAWAAQTSDDPAVLNTKAANKVERELHRRDVRIYRIYCGQEREGGPSICNAHFVSRHHRRCKRRYSYRLGWKRAHYVTGTWCRVPAGDA